jgi:polyhydroxyalkanoate synthesis regulator phasin
MLNIGISNNEKISRTVQLERQLEAIKVENLESEREYMQDTQSEISTLRQQIQSLEQSKVKVLYNYLICL